MDKERDTTVTLDIDSPLGSKMQEEARKWVKEQLDTEGTDFLFIAIRGEEGKKIVCGQHALHSNNITAMLDSLQKVMAKLMITLLKGHKHE